MNDRAARRRAFGATGAPGWGTRPDDFDPELIAALLSRLRLVFGPRRWFRLSATGFEHLPSSPTMVVANHSGGTTTLDVWAFLYAWYRHFGVRRPVHPVAHDLIFSNALTGSFFSRAGALKATRGGAERILSTSRRDLLVMPGGDIDVWRPFRDRYKVCFGGRTGYARMALRLGVPVVPVANVGPHHTLIVLSQGERLAKVLRIHALARANIFPVHLSLPWGLCVGPMPHVPLPLHLRYRVGAPVAPPPGHVPGTEPTDADVISFDASVRDALQQQLDHLREAHRGLLRRVADATRRTGSRVLGGPG